MKIPLDWVQNRFFSEDGRFLTCGTHGASYELETGKCVDGPCRGLSLFSLPVQVIEGEVIVKCPEGDLSFLRD
jgi:nitrite reductase/ring-hydroxylating ferredoxin subunit